MRANNTLTKLTAVSGLLGTERICGRFEGFSNF